MREIGILDASGSKMGLEEHKKKEIPLMSYSGALASSCLESVASL